MYLLIHPFISLTNILFQTLSDLRSSYTSALILYHLGLVNGQIHLGPVRPYKLGPSTCARGKC